MFSRLRNLFKNPAPPPAPVPEPEEPEPEFGGIRHPKECSFPQWGEPFRGDGYPVYFYFWQRRDCLYCSKSEIRMCNNHDMYLINHNKHPEPGQFRSTDPRVPLNDICSTLKP